MKKYLYFFLIVVLVVSIYFNMSLSEKLHISNSKIEEINDSTALLVERNIRQSIANTSELIDTKSKESLFALQRSIGDLTASFSQWYSLNQTEEMPNLAMQKGLNGIEAIRNTVIHHLNRQYVTNEEQLLKEDIEMLEKLHESLNRLLLVYHNIEDRIKDLKDPINSDGGLVQVGSNLEEISRLYRHSSISNRHGEYISIENAIRRAEEQLRFLTEYEVKKEAELVIREGVHAYSLDYSEGDYERYQVYVDALNGSIRSFEYKGEMVGDKNYTSSEILEIARELLTSFYNGKYSEEMLHIKNEEDSLSLYSYRFIPVVEEYKILSDAYVINICSQTGKIVRYINEFNNSDKDIYSHTQNISKDLIINKHSEDIGELVYEGLVVVRSFRTRFKPTLAHSFMIEQSDQQLILYYDIKTGRLVHEMYRIYDQI